MYRARRFPQGRTAQGAYIARDGVLIVTDGEGKPFVDNDGRKYTHALLPKEVRRRLRAALPRKSAGRFLV